MNSLYHAEPTGASDPVYNRVMNINKAITRHVFDALQRTSGWHYLNDAQMPAGFMHQTISGVYARATESGVDVATVRLGSQGMGYKIDTYSAFNAPGDYIPLEPKKGRFTDTAAHHTPTLPPEFASAPPLDD